MHPKYYQLTCFFCRDYSEKKIQENVECEIFQTILEEARESYSNNIVHECSSNTPEDMEVNLENIQAWIQQWHGSWNAL